MAHQVKIPAAGESISSATVGQWHKQDGETVRKGDLLATIETDKVSSDLEAEVEGTLRIAVPEGEEVAIGTVIAEIEKGGARKKQNMGKTAKAAGKQAKKKTAARKAVKTSAKRTKKKAAAEAEAGKKAKKAPTKKAHDQKADNKQADNKQAGNKQAGNKQASAEAIELRVPAAGESIATATIAQWHKRDGERVEAGEAVVTLDTDKVSADLEAEGSGVLKILMPEGKEVKIGALIGTIATGDPPAEAAPGAAPHEPGEDHEEEAEEQATDEAREAGPRMNEEAPAPGDTTAAPEKGPAKLVPDLSVVPKPPERNDRGETSDGRTTRRRMSTLRRKIATQLVKAQQAAAILTTFNEADLSAVMKLRKAVQDDFVKKYGVKLGFMSFFVKAVVQALKAVPSVNARIDGDEIVQNHFYDIGIAVGTEKGLIVPVVRDADQKSFARIEQDILDYATRARDGKIQLEDLQGGSFTISNGGVYGSLLSTPILNPPQSGILGMHTIQQRPVAVDGRVEIRPMMYLALSYDHRLVDGKEAVTFLIHVKNGIESPTRLMFELS